jgi:hypothetical protein
LSSQPSRAGADRRVTERRWGARVRMGPVDRPASPPPVHNEGRSCQTGNRSAPRV